MQDMTLVKKRKAGLNKPQLKIISSVCVCVCVGGCGCGCGCGWVGGWVGVSNLHLLTGEHQITMFVWIV